MTAILRTQEPLWLAIGMLSQFCFFLRFVLQWLASESKGESVIPVSFWHLSLAGALLLFAYSLHRRDPVFILGQLMALCIYARNLYFIRKKGSCQKIMKAR